MEREPAPIPISSPAHVARAQSSRAQVPRQRRRSLGGRVPAISRTNSAGCGKRASRCRSASDTRAGRPSVSSCAIDDPRPCRRWRRCRPDVAATAAAAVSTRRPREPRCQPGRVTQRRYRKQGRSVPRQVARRRRSTGPQMVARLSSWGGAGTCSSCYVRPLDAAEAQPLKATEGAQVPAVSRDGRSVAFWAAGTIKNVPITGGQVAEIASGVEAAPWGMTWGGSGRLYVATADTISVIAPGRPPAPVTKLGEAERSHRHPSLLPGDRVLLFTSVKRTFTWGDEEVVAQTLATGERRVLLSGAAEARYVPSGHLVFLRLGKLCAVPFDPQRVELRGHEVQRSRSCCAGVDRWQHC